MKILSLPQFTSQVKALSSHLAQADDMVHELACSAVYHSVLNGQITPARDLVAAMGKSSRKNDLITWLCNVGNFTWNVGNKTIDYKGRIPQGEDTAKEAHGIAAANPFWMIVAERKVLEEYDVKKALAMILKKVSKYQTDEQYKGKVKLQHLELLEEVKKLAF